MRLFDSILVRKLGDFGRFQWLLAGYLVFMAVPIAFDIDESMFEAHVPDYWCPPPGLDPALRETFNRSQLQQISAPPDQRFGHQCRVIARNYHDLKPHHIWELLHENETDKSHHPTKPCTEWEYFNAEFKGTIVSEWQLVCDREWIAKSQETIYLTGMIIGIILFAIMADRFGRKPVVYCGLVGQTAARLGCAFCYDVVAFTCFRFIEAAFSSAWFFSVFIIAMEYCSPRYRPLLAVLSPVGFALSNMLMVGFAYVLQEWGLLTLAITCFSLPFFIATWYLPESARWYSAVGRNEKAIDLLEKVAKINKVEFPENFKLHVQTPKRKCTPADLIRTPNMRKLTFITLGVWMLLNMAYYGKFVNTHYLPGSIYMHFFFNSAIDIPAMIIYGPIMAKCGRKIPLCVSLIICGTTLVLCVTIPSDRSNMILTGIHVGIYVIGKMAIAGANAILHLHTVEAYPTLLRSMGLAFAASAGRLAGIIGYAIDLFDKYNPVISHVTFALAALAGGVLSLTLPETKGWPLFDSLEEGERCASLQPTWQKWEAWEKWHNARMSRQMSKRKSMGSEKDIPKDAPEREKLTSTGTAESGLRPSRTYSDTDFSGSDDEVFPRTETAKSDFSQKSRVSFDPNAVNEEPPKRERLNSVEFGRQLSDASNFDRSTYADDDDDDDDKKRISRNRYSEYDFDEDAEGKPSTSGAYYIPDDDTESKVKDYEVDDPARSMARFY